MSHDLDWQANAACAGQGAMFEQNPDAAKRRFCDTCPVRDKCLSHAIKHKEIGVWGGLNDMERLSLRNRHKLVVAVPAQVLRDRSRYYRGHRDRAAVAANAAYTKAYSEARKKKTA